MADIGTEVSIKIRSAIKAKLMELGAFVDDELPDYIMVMVANKRSKQQMDVDLQLFLGTNTANFTGWLHTVLQKLEEVTIANNLALNQKKADTNKHTEGAELPSKTKLSTSSAEGEGHKHKHEKKRKSSDGSSKKPLKDSKTVGKGSSLKKSIKSSDLKVTENKLTVEDVANTASGNSSSSKVKDFHLTSLDSESKNVDMRTLGDNSTVSSSKKDVENQQSVSPTKKIMPVSQMLLGANTADPVQKPSLMPFSISPSDEEDEDFLNIKDDAEAMELLDAELSEDTQKLTQRDTTSPQSSASALQVKASGISLSLTKIIPDVEVDELEQQRANLLRDLQLLDKPSKSSSEKRSTLLDRLGSKLPTTSILNRLGARIDSRPRLNIIDPNELDIVRPTPSEVELTKQKVADQLGKRSIVDKESSQTMVSKKSVFSNAPNEELSGERRPVSTLVSDRRDKEMDKDKKVEEFDTIKLNIRDRLGERLTSGTGGKRTVSVVHNDRKHSGKTEPPRPKIMDRLGKKVDPDFPTEKTTSPRRDLEASKPRVADRLGKKMDPDSPTLPRDSEATKLSVMERLGKRHAPGSDAERRNQNERDDHTKRSPRIISIKEAVKGELQHGSSSKRQADEHLDAVEEVPRKRPLLSSRVVAVKRDTAAKATAEDDEEYDPSNPAVASVIRVQPRPKVPASMQASKNLLLKAMAEAQKSVSTAPVRQDTQRSESLYTRKYRGGSGRPVEKINITVANPPKQRFEEESEGFVDERAEEDEERYADERDVIEMENTEQTEAKEPATRKVRQKIIVELPTEVKTVTGEDVMAVDGTNDKCTSDLKIIEDENDDDIIFEEIFDDDLNEEDLNEMNVSNGDSNLGNVSPINNDEIIVDTSEYVPTKIDSPSRGLHRSVRTSSPQFVVTLDGLDPNIFNPRKRTVDASERRDREDESGVVSPVPVLDSDTDDRIHNWLLSLDRVKKEEERNEQNASPVVYKKPKLAPVVVEPVKTKSLDRCKYWPACSKGDLCEFLHPSTPCKMFPGCKFGDRCLYVHPNCKFDISCTRRECPYSHTGVRSGASQVQALTSGKARPHSQPLCKFYPKCSNVNCSFLHPKPCRFGRACTNRDCSFFHEEIPTAEKLKWVNSNRF